MTVAQGGHEDIAYIRDKWSFWMLCHMDSDFCSDLLPGPTGVMHVSAENGFYLIL
jgi:hypothetical protein